MNKHEIEISTHLKDLGVSAGYLGYQYLKLGIEMVIEDMTLVNKIATKLYPSIAKHFDTTPSRVERGIRYAIEVAWCCRGNVKTQDKFFGYTININKGKPTNSEFIATVADFIRMSENQKSDL